MPCSSKRLARLGVRCVGGEGGCETDGDGVTSVWWHVRSMCSINGGSSSSTAAEMETAL